MRSRFFILSLLLVLFGIVQIHGADQIITVFKTATCGCCGGWIEHLKTAGFSVVVKEVPSTLQYEEQYGVPQKLRSCHTAIIDGYTIEGHVPATEIQRLLKERPKAKGLAVPGMPVGSPGMEAGGRRDAYKVFLFQQDGSATVYKEYPAR